MKREPPRREEPKLKSVCLWLLCAGLRRESPRGRAGHPSGRLPLPGEAFPCPLAGGGELVPVPPSSEELGWQLGVARACGVVPCLAGLGCLSPRPLVGGRIVGEVVLSPT